LQTIQHLPSDLSGRDYRSSNMNSSTHPLQHTWVIWEHKALEKGEDWKNSMKEVCEFNSLEEFWKYWAFFPKPSDVLYDGISRKEGDLL
jgi:hypothetical protein